MTVIPASLAPLRRGLLDRAIDYAGLFPPAGLGMPAALANYLAYRTSDDSWALGRFVCPVARLDELEAALLAVAAHRSAAEVPLSALLGSDTGREVQVIQAFNRRVAEHGARVEAVEVKADSVSAVEAALLPIPADWLRYVEVRPGEDFPGALAAIAARGAFAKLRTGGVTPEAIPDATSLAGALMALAARRLPFKATAGLHHPVTGMYPLTYDVGAPRGRMYGYLNLMAAAGLALAGAGKPAVERTLLVLDDAAAAAAGGARPRFLHGFGSCSFREPLDEFPESPRPALR